MKNRLEIVTGGTSNIGLEVVKIFLKRNIDVALVGSSAKSVKEALANVNKEQFEANLHGFDCDLSVSSNINTLVENVIDRFKRIDIIVNSAGILDLSDIENTTEETWNTVQAVNLRAPFFIIQKSLDYLKKSNYARIVNISSNAGRMGGYANGMSYSASKGGLISLTYGLARKLAKYEITVNCVAPGTIESNMLSARDNKTKLKLLENFPIGRFGKSNEVAEAVFYFVKESSGFTTGTVLDVNGGMFTG